jgi:hypothetical protein
MGESRMIAVYSIAFKVSAQCLRILGVLPFSWQSFRVSMAMSLGIVLVKRLRDVMIAPP